MSKSYGKNNISFNIGKINNNIDLKKSIEANKMKFSMISEIGNSNNEESSPKKNFNNINDTHTHEKSRLIAIDENSNENFKEITNLMKQILEE